LSFLRNIPARARCWWLTPIILLTQEAEIRRIAIQSQLGKQFNEILSQKKKKSQKRAGGVAQGVGPDFKPQYWGKKTKEKRNMLHT
jgi:hypothetical protein